MISKLTFLESAHLFTPISVKKTNGNFFNNLFKNAYFLKSRHFEFLKISQKDVTG